MKKLLTLCILALSLSCAIAAPTEPKKWDSTTTDAQKLKDVKANYRAVCERMSVYAEYIMTLRQDNIPLGEVIKIIEARTGGNELEPMVMDAYEEGHYLSAEFRATAIRSFSNKWAMVCMKYFRQ